MNSKLNLILKKASAILAAGALAAASSICLCGCISWSYGSGGIITSADGIISDTIEVEDFDTLDVQMSSYDVMLKRGDKFSVEYKAVKGKEPQIEQKDGKLTVIQPSGLSFNFSFGSGFDHSDTGYTITVPDDRSVALTASSASGDIMTDHVNVTGKVETASGDVLITDTTGGQLEIETVSGDIGTDKISNEKNTFSTTSGEIALLRMDSDVISCDTTSGDINIDNSETGNIACSSVSGEVVVNLNGNPDDYSYDIETVSGDVTVNGVERDKRYTGDSAGDGKIVIDTTSGDIDVSIK